MKITTAQQAAQAIDNLTPLKLKMLVAGLKHQHPHLRNKSDREVKQFLREYVQNNK